jgi:hypothetical protein
MLQECDTVLNHVFKSAIKASFRDYLHERFDEYLAVVPAQDPALWRPQLTMGALKPHICGFVGYGVHALETIEMCATIRRAFAEDGLFAVIRGAEMQAEALRVIALRNGGQVELLLQPQVVPNGEEAQEDEHVIDDGESESGSVDGGDDFEGDFEGLNL